MNSLWKYNPQNEMYQKLKRKVHFLAEVERGKGNKKTRIGWVLIRVFLCLYII